jgi:arsenate reductase
VLDLKYPKENLKSKSWDEYSHPSAPHMDFIITVCDNAKGEACPIWPEHPATLHWGLPDPALVKGSYEEQEKAFKEVQHQLKGTIENLNSCLYAMTLQGKNGSDIMRRPIEIF